VESLRFIIIMIDQQLQNNFLWNRIPATVLYGI
jgi:hypothetical protein